MSFRVLLNGLTWWNRLPIRAENLTFRAHDDMVYALRGVRARGVALIYSHTVALRVVGIEPPLAFLLPVGPPRTPFVRDFIDCLLWREGRGYGDAFTGSGGTPVFPSIVSAEADGAPIGWGALGALSADPADENRLFTGTDNAYGPARILGVDTSQSPAVIDRQIPITENSAPVTLDIEGQGGFVLTVEGEEGTGNELVIAGADGGIEERVALPADIVAGLAVRDSKKWPSMVTPSGWYCSGN